jgi:hypothetical protein
MIFRSSLPTVFKVFSSLTLATSGILVFNVPAKADPGYSVGLQYTFGGEVGISGRVLSTDRSDSIIAGIGIDYYPFAQKQNWDLDFSVGYQFQNVAVTGGWSAIRREPMIGISYVNTRSNTSPVATPATPVAPPPAPPTTPPGGAQT